MRDARQVGIPTRRGRTHVTGNDSLLTTNQWMPNQYQTGGKVDLVVVGEVFWKDDPGTTGSSSGRSLEEWIGRQLTNNKGLGIDSYSSIEEGAGNGSALPRKKGMGMSIN